MIARGGRGCCAAATPDERARGWPASPAALVPRRAAACCPCERFCRRPRISLRHMLRVAHEARELSSRVHAPCSERAQSHLSSGSSCRPRTRGRAHNQCCARAGPAKRERTVPISPMKRHCPVRARVHASQLGLSSQRSAERTRHRRMHRARAHDALGARPQARRSARPRSQLSCAAQGTIGGRIALQFIIWWSILPLLALYSPHWARLRV